MNPKLAERLHEAQSGQAIVLIAFMMIALLGILGLAIDGGGLYFLQRDAQNATDAAVVAATYALCTNGDPVGAARAAATQNGFTDGDGRSTVVVQYPPSEGVAAGDPDYIQIDITATKPAYFIHLVYNAPLQVRTRAVGYCSPPFDPNTVPALYAGSETCPNTIDWTGSSVTIDGDVFSNNEIKFGGGGGGNTVIGEVGLVEDGIESNNTSYVYDHDNNPATAPVPTSIAFNQTPRPDPLPYRLQDYAPGGQTARRAPLYTYINATSGDADWNSNGTWDVSNGRVLEGLYYVDGNVSISSRVNINGDRNGDGTAEGITIVATGDISFNAGPGMAVDYYIDGLIAFSFAGEGRPCSSNALIISGSSANWYGVIYAPHGAVQASLSDLYMVGAIVSNTMNMSGSDLDLIWDPTLLPPRPPQVQIAE